MSSYLHLKTKIRSEQHRLRAVRTLKGLRGRLEAVIPPKEAQNTLLFATWNLRDFDRADRRGYGPRLDEMLFYIAEVLSKFDFVAVQEVHQLNEWLEIMEILGPDYSYICSEAEDEMLGGSGRRMMFVFDRRKVQFVNSAGEIALPNTLGLSEAAEHGARDLLSKGKQFSRPPYAAHFCTQGLRFSTCTAHFNYGAEIGDKLRQRMQEMKQVIGYFSQRADRALKEKSAMILLGDFNIVYPGHQVVQLLEDEGFVVPEVLKTRSNYRQNKFYDQIAFKTDPAIIAYREEGKEPNAGVVKLFEMILTEADAEAYMPDAAETPNGARKSDPALCSYYRDWKTYQLSDHCPVWARVEINTAKTYFEDLEDQLRQE